jgi:ABC-2 type transport system permease protein
MHESESLRPLNEHGWRCGFANLLRQENHRWWGTRRWLVQSVIWLLIFNGFLALLIWVLLDETQAERVDAGLIFIMAAMSFFVPVTVIIVTQGAIVSEKQSGTAAWVLSKPVSRSAFVLSKLIAHATGLLVIMIVLQGTIAYLQLSLCGGDFLPVLPYVAAMLLHSLHALFYLTLTIMLGAIFAGRGAVIGIPLAVFIGQHILGSILWQISEEILKVLPSRLPDLAMQLVTDEPLSSLIPIATGLVGCVVFVVVALRRFEREEF